MKRVFTLLLAMIAMFSCFATAESSTSAYDYLVEHGYSPERVDDSPGWKTLQLLGGDGYWVLNFSDDVDSWMILAMTDYAAGFDLAKFQSMFVTLVHDFDWDVSFYWPDSDSDSKILLSYNIKTNLELTETNFTDKALYLEALRKVFSITSSDSASSDAPTDFEIPLTATFCTIASCILISIAIIVYIISIRKRRKELDSMESLIKDRTRQLEELNSALVNTQKLHNNALAEAKDEAFKALEIERANIEHDCVKRREQHALLLAEYNSLYEAMQKLQKEKATAEKRIANLKPLAKSIQAAQNEMVQYSLYGALNTQEIKRIQELNFDELLPEPELNCLDQKDLAAKYRNIRKQIIEVCNAHEARYTSKTYASLYKLMVLALESEFENILYTLRFGKLDSGIAAVKELTKKCYAIATDGNQTIAPTLKRFIVQIESLYLDALHVEYEYYVQRERAKEEQRAIREQMRLEAEERKRLEQERAKVEAEESKYQIEIDRIAVQMQQAHDAELETLRKRLVELNALMEKVTERKEEIINLQNGKAGTVYIISNIGAFGDHVYKIGMTRRLEPQERINELSNASVPFPFDVHSFIFSTDAVALETALHRELDSRRVNKVNRRKEFFDVGIDELKGIVERIDPTASFKATALAEQYRQSLSLAEDV